MASLVLSTGSRAGTEAPLQVGYYMIGRHKECQIRPKSKSVSRRHCVVQRAEQPEEGSRLSVFDLNSTSGTTVNDEKIPPRQWCPLSEGDSLRLGKICFTVRLQPVTDSVGIAQTTAGQQQHAKGLPEPELAHAEAVAPAVSGPAVSGPADSGATMVTGKAWEAFDVADFLEAEDEVDREQRYEGIRVASGTHRVADTIVDEDSALSGDDDLFSASDEDSGDYDETSSNDKTPISRNARDAASLRKGKPGKKLRTWSLPSLDFSRFSPSVDDQGRLKILLVIVVTIAVLSIAGYRVYQFASGPEVRVLNELD